MKRGSGRNRSAQHRDTRGERELRRKEDEEARRGEDPPFLALRERERKKGERVLGGFIFPQRSHDHASGCRGGKPVCCGRYSRMKRGGGQS